ncbi:hypothetical protein AB751O23_AG_00250 [Chlamydiales bacterium SCGC AB-751-O23]|jgi:hypothetical protein|nr:hypothetical protein AB751O23_AG_00250 [Chlamydiales bacterium SCGC AB-751-O23]
MAFRFSIISPAAIIISFFSLFGSVQEVKEINSILDIHPYLKPNSIIILDLDNTLITSSTDLGNAHWYHSCLQIEQLKGKTRKEAQKNLNSIWIEIQNSAEHHLVENNTPYLLKNLKQFPKTTLLSITGREPRASKITLDMLDKLHISLERPSQNNFQLNFYTPHPSFYTEGIIFAGLNKKSAIVRQLVQSLTLQKIPFEQIIFVDDQRITVEAVKKVCQDLNLNYTGLKYNHVKTRVGDFSLARAYKQLDVLRKGLSNQDAETLLSTRAGVEILKNYIDPIQFPKRKDTSLTSIGKQPPLDIKVNKNHSETKIIESFHLDEVLRYANQKTLIVFGLGETLISSETLLGSSTWGWEMINHNLSKGISFEDASDNLIPLWNDLSAKIAYKAVEINTPDTIRKLQKKGAPMIAITGHYIEVAHPILSKLKNIGIDFSQSAAAKKDFTLHTPYPSKFISGIIFTGFQNSKGGAFLKYLDQSEVSFDKIIFVDDNLDNIEEMKKAAIIINKPYLGILYKGGHHTHKSLNPDIAKLQWIFLNKILPNHLTDLLMGNNSSSS